MATLSVSKTEPGSSNLPTPANFMTKDRIQIGAAAEYIFIGRCLSNGLDCSIPVTNASKVDVTVGRHRCQVKAITAAQGSAGRRGISVRKAGCNSRSNVKTSRYCEKDVDFIVAVDIETCDVFIMPILKAMDYRRQISEKSLKAGGHLNAFHLLKEF